MNSINLCDSAILFQVDYHLEFICYNFLFCAVLKLITIASNYLMYILLFLVYVTDN